MGHYLIRIRPYTSALSSVLDDVDDKEDIYKKLKISYSHAINYYKVSKDKEAEVKGLIKNLLPNDLLPFDHVEDILKFANKNVIVTHKHRDGVLSILQHYNWEKYFADIVTIDDGFLVNLILLLIVTYIKNMVSI